MNSIPLKKDPFCDGLEAVYEEGLNDLNNSVKTGRDRFDYLKDDLIPKIEVPKMSIDIKLSKINDIIDSLGDGMTIDLSECEKLFECLGTSVNDLFGLNPDLLLKDKNIDLSKYPQSLADSVTKFVDDTLDTLLDTGEKELLDALKKLENLVDTDLIDDLLALAGCLAGHCDPPSSLSTDLDIEKKLEEMGLNISGEADLDKLDMKPDDAEYFKKLKTGTDKLNDVLNRNIKRIF